MFGFFREFFSDREPEQIVFLRRQVHALSAEKTRLVDELLSISRRIEKYRNDLLESQAEVVRLSIDVAGHRRAMKEREEAFNRLQDECAGLKKQNEALSFKLSSAQDATSIFADRYKISAAELRQLQVADMVIHEAGEDGRNKREVSAQVRDHDASDPLQALNDGNDFKQTAGKFRQLRQNFVTLQLALTAMFDAMERHADKRPMTREGIRGYRQDASAQIGRRI